MKNLILALIALFASSCGCGRINSAAAAAEGDGIECRDNDECDDGEECRDAKCLPVGELSCDDGEELKDGECVCVDEQACGGEPSEGEGEPECLLNADCGVSGIVCLDAECVEIPSEGEGEEPECRLNADCGANEVCLDAECVPADVNGPCVRNVDCGDGEVCLDAQCVDMPDVPVDPPSGDDVLCVWFDQAVDVDEAGFFTDGDEAFPADQDNVTHICVTLDLAANGLAHFNLRLDGTVYLAYNDNNQRSALNNAFDRFTLNGSTVTVTALPVQCADDPRGCTGSERIPTTGVDAWIGVEPDAVECNDNGDCSGTDVCLNAQCVPAGVSGCANNADCGANQVCLNAQCVQDPGVECTFNDDCVGDEVCLNAECILQTANACADNGDCVGTDVCLNAACVPTNGTCTDTGDCGSGETCLAGDCVVVTGGGPPPTGQAAAIIENASGKETVLEIRADQFPLCNSATGCSNGDPEVFRKSAAHVVDLAGCMNQVLYSPEDEAETGIVDPTNDLVSVVDGVFRIDFSLARFSCPGNQFARIFLVSTVHKDGSGRPNPDWDYRNVDWRTTAFNGVGSAFLETDPYTGFAIVEVELIYDADGNLLRIEPGA